MFFSQGNSPALAFANMKEDDPRFKQALSCCNDPPPPYPSEESTQFPSPEPSDYEQHEAHKTVERLNSTVYYQFQHQKWDEEAQLRKHPARGPFDFDEVARATIIKRWTEQGIWNNKWDPQNLTLARWKHEEPLALDDRSGRKSPSPSPIFAEKQVGTKDDRGTPRPSADIAREATEREASRPLHQFEYQVLKEQEYIEATTASVHKRAYENVKQRWIDRGIWDARWLRLPGMSWKHETPNVPQHPSVKSPRPPNTTSLAPAVHSNLHQALAYSSSPDPSNRNLLRNGNRPGKKAAALTRVSGASKANEMQSSRTYRPRGVMKPLRRSERIKKQRDAQAISIVRSVTVKPVTEVESPELKREKDNRLICVKGNPRGVVKRATKPFKQGQKA
ncbi:MAG: hypothetical protein Q9173_001902 [Seirophora scorigena]